MKTLRVSLWSGWQWTAFCHQKWWLTVKTQFEKDRNGLDTWMLLTIKERVVLGPSTSLFIPFVPLWAHVVVGTSSVVVSSVIFLLVCSVIFCCLKSKTRWLDPFCSKALFGCAALLSSDESIIHLFIFVGVEWIQCEQITKVVGQIFKIVLTCQAPQTALMDLLVVVWIKP